MTEVEGTPASDVREDESRSTVARNAAFEARFGRLVLAAGRHERYRSLPISDLQPLLLEPLRAGRVAIGSAGKDGVDPASTGVAIWASVSPDVAATIAEQADAGVFPIRLRREDWRSGPEVWLLDVIAPDARVGTAVFSAFAAEIDGGFRMHPVAMRSLEPEVVKRIVDVASARADAGDV